MSAFRMAQGMSQTIPQSAETSIESEESVAPRVNVLLAVIDDSDVAAAVATVERQAYEPAPSIVLVGSPTENNDDLAVFEDLESAIAETGSEIDYLWLLHSDARPRPDALGALVAEAERNEAAVAGSKLLRAGTTDILESVGGATDVFGEPYSGLDEGEIDLQQYDVVREVAFVSSTSMLVRRDLAQGLRGLDPLLPPVAAGLDFSQRARLSGARVITVPSSEVYHQDRCSSTGWGWREQAGRLRAITTAYSPLTLLWVLPYDFLVSLADSLANLVLLRWRPLAGHVLSWLWNLLHLPSTFRQRRRLRAVRSEGDEELFRFHAKGSVRLRNIGEEVSGRFLSMFDDDQALSRSTRRMWRSPGIWGAFAALVFALIAARGLFFDGIPDSGFSFSFEAPTTAFDRWWGGWNDSGLGSAAPVHPAVGFSALGSALLLGAESAFRSVFTIALGLLGVVGMGRLGGRLGLKGPGRYLAGLVMIGGPLVADLTGRGSWTTLAAAGLVPWLVRATVLRDDNDSRTLGRYGATVLFAVLVSMLSPVAVAIPLLVYVISRLISVRGADLRLSLVALSGVLVAAPFMAGDVSWLLDPVRALGTAPGLVLPLVIAIGGLAAWWRSEGDTPAVLGSIISLGAIALSRFSVVGPGLEEAVALTAALGAAILVAATLDRIDRDARSWLAALGGLALLLAAAGVLLNGSYGLQRGELNERLSFAETLADNDHPGRLLLASTNRDDLPGEPRSGPGFWYRLVDGSGMTQDEAWLPEPASGDDQLASELEQIATGGVLRPGAQLAPFAIGWVVLFGPEFRLDETFTAQLDLVPTPLDDEARVFANPSSEPIAGSEGGDDGVTWERSGTGFSGPPVDEPMTLAINASNGWSPEPGELDWRQTVSGSDGEAVFSGAPAAAASPLAVAALLLAATTLIVLGRRSR